MIVRLYAIARLLTFVAAGWILALVFLSFASIHVWTPPYLIWLMVGGFLMQIGLWAVLRARRR